MLRRTIEPIAAGDDVHTLTAALGHMDAKMTLNE